MTLRLILLRHAKSGWDDPLATDHARTLTARGQTAARQIGTWLRDEGFVPDLILCSDATRTRQTVDGLIETLGHRPETKHMPGLYHAAPDVILQTIRQSGDAGTLLVCGHNPGIADLARRLVTDPPSHPRFADYPTAATTVISCDVATWAQVRAGTCTAFVVPADLTV